MEFSRRQAEAQELPWVRCFAVAELAGVLVLVRDGYFGCSRKALCAHVCGCIPFHFVLLRTIDHVRVV